MSKQGGNNAPSAQRPTEGVHLLTKHREPNEFRKGSRAWAAQTNLVQTDNRPAKPTSTGRAHTELEFK